MAEGVKTRHSKHNSETWIDKLESGVSVCELYGVKKQIVSDTCKNKEKLIQFLLKYGLDTSSKGGFTGRDKKHVKPAQNRNREVAVYKWFVQQWSSGIVVHTVLILIKLQYNVKDIFILKNSRFNGHPLAPISLLNWGFTLYVLRILLSSQLTTIQIHILTSFKQEDFCSINKRRMLHIMKIPYHMTRLNIKTVMKCEIYEWRRGVEVF
jgi:hypothetical protein